jgi:hypothetical protein
MPSEAFLVLIFNDYRRELAMYQNESDMSKQRGELREREQRKTQKAGKQA